VARTLSDFFQGQTDKGLFYKPNYSGKLGCPNRKKKKKKLKILEKKLLPKYMSIKRLGEYQLKLFPNKNV
jgi:hypothetical protein